MASKVMMVRNRSKTGNWAWIELSAPSLDCELKDGRKVGDVSLREFCTLVSRHQTGAKTPEAVLSAIQAGLNVRGASTSRSAALNRPNEAKARKDVGEWVMGQMADDSGDPELAVEIAKLASTDPLAAWEKLFGVDCDYEKLPQQILL